MTFDRKWPEGFMNIGGKTFAWTYDNKIEFVDFTVREMKAPTGLFKHWQKYCLKKNTK